MECTLREWNLSIFLVNSYRNITLGQPRKFSKNENFKSNRNIIQIKNVFPGETLKTLYTSLISSYLNYGLLLWGVKSHKVEIMQKKPFV